MQADYTNIKDLEGEVDWETPEDKFGANDKLMENGMPDKILVSPVIEG